MGQHLEFVKQIKEKSDLGYESTKSVYHAKDCSRCPLRGMCYKGKHNARIIEVNHRNNELRAMARELLTSDEGLMHRSRRPIEPEAVFRQIKYDNHFKRFRGPRRSRGRDEVGTRSDETKPNLPYRHCRHIHINTKGGD